MRDLGPRILEEGLANITGAQDAASCVYRNSFHQCLACTAVVGRRVVVLHCDVKPKRFEEFRPLFLFIARSVRIGEAAMAGVDSPCDVSKAELASATP